MDPLDVAFVVLIAFTAAMAFLSVVGKEISHRERVTRTRYLTAKQERAFARKLKGNEDPSGQRA